MCRSSLVECLVSIHCFMMQETQQLLQAGLQPTHFSAHEYRPNPPQEFSTASKDSSNSPSTYSILMEKIQKLNKALTDTQDICLPYVGPRTCLQFLECFSEIFLAKKSRVSSDRESLSRALAALSNTREQAGEMKSTLRELRHRYEQSSKLSDKLLKSLTLKSCQLEKLRALTGQSSSVLSAMQMVSQQERQLVENEEDDEELLAVFMDRQTTRLETLLVCAREQLRHAEREEAEAKQAMVKSKEAALHWHAKIDRNAIDQIKSLNNPPRLVGTIMELMLTLLKQYGVGGGAESQVGSASESSSSSTPGHPVPGKRKKSFSSTSVQTSRIDKEHWNTIQLAIGDSQRFLDLLNGLKWEDGLSTDAVNLILSMLAVPGRNVPHGTVATTPGGGAGRTLAGSGGGGGGGSGGGVPEGLITVSMARHAAESVANMCAFVVSIVEYNDSFKPYKLASEKLLRYVNGAL